MIDLDPRLQYALDRRAARLGATARDPDPAKAKRDAAELLRHDDPDAAYRYLSTRTEHGFPSTCAIEVRDYLEDLGGMDPEIVGAYLRRIGKAMIDVETVAVRHGAWAKDLTEVGAVGDVYRIDNAERRNAHVLVVVRIDPATGVIHSIDGGQGPDSTYTLSRARVLVCPEHKGFKPYLVDPVLPYKPGGEPNGREVTGRVDVAAFLGSLAA